MNGFRRSAQFKPFFARPAFHQEHRGDAPLRPDVDTMDMLTRRHPRRAMREGSVEFGIRAI
jgi:hypothetical protein